MNDRTRLRLERHLMLLKERRQIVVALYGNQSARIAALDSAIHELEGKLIRKRRLDARLHQGAAHEGPRVLVKED